MEAGGKHIFFDNGDNMCFYFVKNAVGRGMGWMGQKKQQQSGETVSKELKGWLLPSDHKWQ